jgi:hypothetical protein
MIRPQLPEAFPLRHPGWTQAQWIRFVAGLVVLLSLSLSFLHPYWLFLTAFVGLNLLQSAFSNWCPLIWILKRLQVPEV